MDQMLTLAMANETLTIRVVMANHRAALSADTFVEDFTLKIFVIQFVIQVKTRY